MNIKKKKMLVTFLILVELSFIFLMSKSLGNKNINEQKFAVNSNTFALLLETGYQTGEYETASTNAWPGRGYYLNVEKSYCEKFNGDLISDVLTYNPITKTAILTSNQISLCNLYFNYDNLNPSIKSFNITEEYTNNSMVNVELEFEDDDVYAYCLTENNSCGENDWVIDSDIRLLTIYSLLGEDGQKNINAFVIDHAGNISDKKIDTVTLDKTVPTIIVTDVVDRDESALDVSAGFYDNLSLNSYDCSEYPPELSELTNSANGLTAVLNDFAFDRGNKTIRCYAKDHAGNINYQDVFVYLTPLNVGDSVTYEMPDVVSSCEAEANISCTRSGKNVTITLNKALNDTGYVTVKNSNDSIIGFFAVSTVTAIPSEITINTNDGVGCGTNAWHNSSLTTITLSGSVTSYGTVIYNYWLTGQSKSSGNTINIPSNISEGTYTYNIQACNSRDNTMCGDVKTCVINIDKTAPTITVSNELDDGTAYASNNAPWTNKNIISKITYSDADSLINVSSLKWGYGNWTTGGNPAALNSNNEYVWSAITHGSQSNTSARFQVCDKAGNCTYSDLFDLKFDITGPTFKTWQVTNDNVWTNGTVSVTMSTEDDKSGVDGYKYSYSSCNGPFTVSGPNTSNISWSNTINSTIYLKLVDRVGNYSAECKTVNVRIDNSEPIATISADVGEVSLSCSDNYGVTGYYFGNSYPTSNSTYFDITSQTNFTTTKSVTENGTYYLACKDASGNVSTVVNTEVSLDKVEPTATISNTNGSTITLTCTDNEGVTSYYIGTDMPNTTDDFITIPSTKNFSTTYTATSADEYRLICIDAAGNIGSDIKDACSNIHYEGCGISNELLLPNNSNYSSLYAFKTKSCYYTDSNNNRCSNIVCDSSEHTENCTMELTRLYGPGAMYIRSGPGKSNISVGEIRPANPSTKFYAIGANSTLTWVFGYCDRSNPTNCYTNQYYGSLQDPYKFVSGNSQMYGWGGAGCFSELPGDCVEPTGDNSSTVVSAANNQCKETIQKPKKTSSPVAVCMSSDNIYCDLSDVTVRRSASQICNDGGYDGVFAITFRGRINAQVTCYNYEAACPAGYTSSGNVCTRTYSC